MAANPRGDVPGADWRYRSLLEIVDLIGVHSTLDEMLPALAGFLARIVDFDMISFALMPPAPGNGMADVCSIPVVRDGPAIRVMPATNQQLAEPDDPGLGIERFRGTPAPAVVHDIEFDEQFPELRHGMREHGIHALCILGMNTPVRFVGCIAFSARQPGAFANADLPLLSRMASLVAVAIDNVRNHQAAATYREELATDRDHWRTLLEVNNAIVGNLDLTALLNALAPNLRRVLPHDVSLLALLDEHTSRLEVFAIDPPPPPGVARALATIDVRKTPAADVLALRQPLVFSDHELASLPGVLREAEYGRAKHVCLFPLLTPRRILGIFGLFNLVERRFTPDDIRRGSATAAQLAIALENALAFQEIAALKDRLTLENRYLEEEVVDRSDFEEIIGDSRELQRVLSQVRSVADTDSTVLLLGETGTGKELIARAIHNLSPRKGRPLVAVNCASSPAGLLESEWFGHEKGAFTGALAQKMGRFELANQGTLFLDEIGDVPLDLQAKLLRVLQERQIERLGSTRSIHVDFRLVAATNRNLDEMVASREYRSDLYYRLNVFPIRIPPLRERPEDIPALVRYFTQRYARRLRRRIDSVPADTMDVLCRWSWPGNVRELQNVVERAVILSRGSELDVQLVEFRQPAQAAPNGTLEASQRDAILRALDDTGWVIGGPAGAAARLGVKRTTLASTMKRLGIVRPTPSSRG